MIRNFKTILLTISFLSLLACSEDPQQNMRSDSEDLLGEADLEAENSTPSDEALDLIGGVIANPAEYPASVLISSGYSRCTATVVGKRVVFTAAHCVGNGGSISFTVASNRYTARCTHHQGYRGNSTADWALCKTNADVTGIAFEIVNTDPSILRQGASIQLSGYGCRQAGGRDGMDGRYRIGDSTIIRVPNPAASNHDIVTRGQGAALCFGDSGGPAFAYLDAERKERVLVGVNSRGDIRTTSYLSSVSQNTSRTWMTNWAAANNVEICGVNVGAENCRLNKKEELSAECQAMENMKALDQVTKCARLKGEEAASCMEAQDLVSACIASRLE